MLADIAVVEHEGSAALDDGATIHTFTDPDALRRFIHVWRVLRQQFPAVEFALNDDASIASWSGTAPQPTPAQIAAGVTALRAAELQQAADTTALRTRVWALAQSAVGVQLDQLSAPQVRALIAVLLHKQGAIDTNGAIRPLADWG